MEEFIASLEDQHSLDLFKKLPKGKRLRAKLILKIAGESRESYKLAAIVELVHAASLLHDDVIDDALTRRGKDSINAIYGNKTSIMLGDILYSKAFAELSNFSSEIAYRISSAVSLLSVGELLDMALSEQFNDNKTAYFDMIYKKTAILIEAAAASAAMLCGKDASLYETYGRNLGLAFQVIDDVLDITQSSEVLGKPSLSDFKEGKTTLPYLYLYERINTEEQHKLISLFKKDLDKDDKMWIKNRMKETSSLNDSIQYAKELGLEALSAIKDENNDGLTKIIKEMIEREF
ncbi:polyprenyl synthetase family protein [Sulfurospirillum sp. 1612]|uniref:polyprenyl synthetase family protein n=1 Tax=Sulfurospirillum sp. 1612 TaxID=3094835 RepID=UPI003FCE0250